VRERRGQFAKIADTITGTMRRRQRDREPRVLLHGADGRPRTLSPSDDAHPEIVELAERLVALAGGGHEHEAEPGPEEAAE
jgi:hypothetical protein